MSEGTIAFAAGFATATIGVVIVAKIMKPQIVNIASQAATDSLVRFLQSRGFDMSLLPGTPETVKTQLIVPAMNDALSRVWL